MTELHTIEVRYEDTDGRHVDVHDAAEHYRYDDEVVVYSDVCACCDAEEKETVYDRENFVKAACGPTEHEREDREVSPLMWWLPLLLVMLATSIAFVAFILSVSGGTVSL